MKLETYKGFVIEARRVELQNNLGWSTVLLIKKHDKDSVTAKEIQVKGVFETEDEAIESGLAQGRKVIDAGFLI
ncbi:MAG: hypothetical protein WB341_09555 [Terracidiphilus sp.]